MSKSKKVLLGIATIWPMLYIGFFIIALAVSLFSIREGAPDENVLPALFMVIIPLHFLTIFLALAMLVFYIVHALRNERIKKDSRPLWAVLLFFGSIIAMSVYWYMYIWKDEEADTLAGREPVEIGSGM